MKTPVPSCDLKFVHEDRVRSARKAIHPAVQTGRLSELFKVLSDPTRLRIVFALSREELCVCDLAALLEMTDSAISHQLRLLKNLSLVKHRRKGKMAYYSLDDSHIDSLIRIGLSHVQES